MHLESKRFMLIQNDQNIPLNMQAISGVEYM